MHGESAFKIGTILLLIGFAVGGAQLTAQADAVTTLEAQVQAPGVQSEQESSVSAEVSPEDLAASLRPATDVDSVMRKMGFGSLRDDAEAAANVEQMNSGHFRPFQSTTN